MFFLLQNRRTGGWKGGLAPMGGGGGRESGRRMNIVQTMNTHVYKCKNDTC
jgi:hypothetical protein